MIELIFVLVLVAALLGLAVPLLSNAFPGVEMRSATRDVATALRAARNRAITENREAAFTLDVQNRQYVVSGSDRIRTLPEGFDISVQSAAGAGGDERTGRIYFFPDGSSSGGIITLARGDRRHRVTVDWLLGRIAVAE